LLAENILYAFHQQFLQVFSEASIDLLAFGFAFVLFAAVALNK